MKVQIDLRVRKEIKQGINTLLSKVEDLTTIEVEIPDEWLKVIDVLPRSFIYVEVSGATTVENPETARTEAEEA